VVRGSLRLLQAHALGDRDAKGEIRAALSTADDHTLATAVWNVAAALRDLPGARELARYLTIRLDRPAYARWVMSISRT
jgi:hypothetical protein